MKERSHNETLDILSLAHAAFEKGDTASYVKISQQLPLAPHLAVAAKEIFGVDYLLNSGFDLSEAEACYGKNWLNS